MKAKSRYVLAFLLLTTLLMPIAAAYAATSGTSDGSAGVNNVAPAISNPSFTDTASADKNNSQIDVNTEYWISCTIQDNNQLSDLDTVTYKIWGPSSTEGGADSETAHYTFTYTQSSDTWTEIGPDGAGNSHLVSASCQDPADQTAASGSFRLAFKLAKVAERTATATWTVKISVTDDGANSDSDSSLVFGVNFYTEITIDDASHSWTNLNPEATDQELSTPVDADIDITVTANANFDVQAKGSGALTSGGNTLALSNVKIHATTLGSAVALTTIYADIGGLTAQAAGSSQAKAFKLWLTVPSPQPSGTYSYTLYVQVVEA